MTFKKRNRRSVNRKNMTIEKMEDRQLFATDLISGGFLAEQATAAQHADFDISLDVSSTSIILSNDVVRANGTNSRDIVTVERLEGTPTSVTLNTATTTSRNSTSFSSNLATFDMSSQSVSQIVLGPRYRFTIANSSGDILSQESFFTYEVSSFVVNSYNGDDLITNNTSLPSTIWAGPGNDVVNGGSGADVINGNTGNDWLYGLEGNDSIYGGDGTDRVYGGDGNDIVSGQNGNDWVYGGAGNDSVYGGNGEDMMYGGAGNDTMSGQYGNDRMWGNDGNDSMWGGSGNDDMYGGNGNDTVRGDAGNDEIQGNNGNDYAYGGSGNDDITGGSGDDRLYGQNNNDTIDGNSGADRVYGGDGADEVRGGSGNDSVYGGNHNDRVFGDSGNDNVYGDAGSDQLFGGSGTDYMRGGSGNDTLISIDNNTLDTLYGDSGTDSFWIDREGWWIFGSKDDVRDDTAYERNNNLHEVDSFANGADKTLNGDNITDPTDGANYKNFADQPLFASTGPSAEDIDQGNLADCWMLAGIGATADMNQNRIRQTVVELGDGTYAVSLGDDFYRVDADLPTDSPASTTLTYAGLGVQDSIWAPIVEKAYTHYRTGANTYDSLGWGSSGDAFSALGASNSYKSNFSHGSHALNHIRTALNDGKAVVVGIDTPSSGCPCVGSHAYIVDSVNTIAGIPVSVTLRNPWGVDGGGSTDGVNDGLVTITGTQLFDSMSGIRTASV